MNNSAAKNLEVANILFFKEVESILRKNQKVIFRLKGGSMRPFLQDGDTVRITPVIFDTLRRGDIILARTIFGVLLHRVVSIRKDGFCLAGDANRRLEQVARENIIGILDAAWREGRELNINSSSMRILAFLWYGLRPFRGHLLGLYYRWKNKNKRQR